jgi:hypothetical protein
MEKILTVYNLNGGESRAIEFENPHEGAVTVLGSGGCVLIAGAEALARDGVSMDDIEGTLKALVDYVMGEVRNCEQ